jgi:hypothetical protein
MKGEFSAAVGVDGERKIAESGNQLAPGIRGRTVSVTFRLQRAVNIKLSLLSQFSQY